MPLHQLAPTTDFSYPFDVALAVAFSQIMTPAMPSGPTSLVLGDIALKELDIDPSPSVSDLTYSHSGGADSSPTIAS